MNEKIIEWIENAQNIVADELPSFIQEVVTFGFWSNVVESIIGIIILISLLFCAKKFWDYGIKKQHCDRDESAISFIISILITISSIIPLLVTMTCIKLAIKAAYAPKLYIIERFM